MKVLMRLAFIAAAVFALSSCSTPKNIVYFQDTYAGTKDALANQQIVKLRPGDQLLITVDSKDPELANLFNKTSVNQMGNTSVAMIGYTVDSKGDIEYPVLGPINVEGMTREQVAETIQSTLRSRSLVKDAVVTVEFMNLTVTVLGEVAAPGMYQLDRDNLTILDAIARAGDLKITGLRENVKVFRKSGSEEQTYIVNLTSASQTFSSPVYYMQQGDIIYVEPNGQRIRETTSNGNTVRQYAFWMSLASFLMSIGVIIAK